VNALNKNKLAVRTKERGREKTKVKWAIEMNEARQLYLASYGRIDTIDSLIKNCNMFYVSWKYWHASKLHVQALAVVVAYDMYKEIVEEAWAQFGFATKQEAMKKCMLDFHAFRDQLAMQGLRYNPEAQKYKGDMAMRVNTKRKKAPLKEGQKRAVGRPRKTVTPDGDDVEGFAAAAPQVTLAQLNELKKPITGRLCGDLNKYMFHRQNIETVKHRITCKFCGKYCYTRCRVCGLAAHDNPQRGEHIGNDCFTKLHNDHCFGLAITDCKRLKTDESKWRMPTSNDREKNSRHIQEIQRVVPYALRRRAPTVEDT
jgi:hypothetical protein